MKKLILLLSICITSNLLTAQKVDEIESEVKYNCSQKYGLTESDDAYILKVSYDSENLMFSTSEKQKMFGYSVTKKTDKYIIGKNTQGYYSFYDLTKKQFYYIDYYMKRYMTAGYGSQSSEIKQTTLKMMGMLKNQKSQKDVIQYLIEQTEYDF